MRKSINLKQFKEEDFIILNNQYQLEYKNNKKYYGVFIKIMIQYREDMFRYIQSYYRFFMKKKSVSEMPVYYIKDKNDIN